MSGFLNLGNGDHAKAGPHSNYALLWMQANGGRPSKGQGMNPEIFHGKFLRVEIGDTVKNSKGGKHPAGAVYSTIKEFLEVMGP